MTPEYVEVLLDENGWKRRTADEWERPGYPQDIHTWPVAYLIQTGGWEHVDPPVLPEPPAVRPPPKPGFKMGGANRRKIRLDENNEYIRPKPKPSGPPKPAHRPVSNEDVAEEIVRLRQEEKLKWREIAERVGKGASMCNYLYNRHLKDS